MNRLLPLGAALLLLAACTPQPPAQSPQAAVPAVPRRPLASFATEPVVLLPLQAVYPADSLGWAAALEDDRAFRRRVDDEIAFALAQRGVAAEWIFPEALARSVRRNPGYATDPYRLDARPLAPGIVLEQGRLPEPLASQLRRLVSLGEARYVLMPAEVRFLRAGSGGVASMRVALLDARAAEVRGAWDVLSDTLPTFSAPALATALADRFADLIAAP